MSSEQYERGVEILKQIDEGFAERIMERFKDVAPDLARYAVEFPFGEICSRPGLDLKTREMVAIAALAALGNATRQLKVHINAALTVGCTREEIVEIIIQMAVYAGFPAALNGMTYAKEVFEERDKAGLN